jgi:hypothetical protein
MKEKTQKEWDKLRTRTEIWSRIVGYIRPVQQWNKAKQEEFKDRKVYKNTKNILKEYKEAIKELVE